MRNLPRPTIAKKTQAPWSQDKDSVIHILHKEFGLENEAYMNYADSMAIFKDIYPENYAYESGHMYDRCGPRFTLQRRRWWFDIDRPNSVNGAACTQEELQDFARLRALVVAAAGTLGVALTATNPPPWSAQLPAGAPAAPVPAMPPPTTASAPTVPSQPAAPVPAPPAAPTTSGAAAPISLSAAVMALTSKVHPANPPDVTAAGVAPQSLAAAPPTQPQPSGLQPGVYFFPMVGPFAGQRYQSTQADLDVANAILRQHLQSFGWEPTDVTNLHLVSRNEALYWAWIAAHSGYLVPRFKAWTMRQLGP